MLEQKSLFDELMDEELTGGASCDKCSGKDDQSAALAVLNNSMLDCDHRTPRTLADNSCTIDLSQPLAARLRPRDLDEFAGQKHLVGEGKILRKFIESDHIPSIIFWGSPGIGKTTLARIIARRTRAKFIDFSAVTSGIKEIREIMAQAEQNRQRGHKTILFVDEIHRFNKAQQDAFLPFVEKGSITLIGATTENPSFEVNAALLSRCKVFVFKALETDDVMELLRRALSDKRGFGWLSVEISDECLRLIAEFAGGDARSALSTLEMVVLNSDEIDTNTKDPNKTAGCKNDHKNEHTHEKVSEPTNKEANERMRQCAGKNRNDECNTNTNTNDGYDDGYEVKPAKIIVTRETIAQCTSKKTLLYDKGGEEHYNLISALHKSMRNSDPDAAVYWLARMLEAGENPLYVARRVVRFASEDVGLADPRALEVAVAAYQACHFIGMPECVVHLTEAVVYLSIAPKSNAMEVAYDLAKLDALKHLTEPVPLHLRNAPTKLMKELEYGKGYQYAHDYREKMTAMQCLPDALANRRYYQPTEQGVEAKYKARLQEIREWKKAQRTHEQG